MALVTSTAFTQQTKTCYSFHTAAGPSAFFSHYRATLDALLHPNYSDEEIRREVRNFGVSEANGQLHLEEKGTVYNEMTSSMDQAGRRMYQAALGVLYGPEHPESFSAGGLPSALRNLQPSDIRRFHAANYFLANIASVVSLPKEVTINSALTQIGNTLNAVGGPVTKNQKAQLVAKMPPPRPGDGSKVIYTEYPYQTDQQPSSAMLVWPASLKLNYRDRTLIDLFLSNVAGGAGTNLYKRFIDSKTREYALGARTVSAGAIDATGSPILVQFSDLPVARLQDSELEGLRAKVMDEFAKIAAYADGSPELTEFHQRLRSRIVQQRRSLAKLVNSPPGFGTRGGGSSWFDHLRDLNESGDFRKSVTMKGDLDFMESLAKGTKNVWRDYLKQWNILDTTPVIVAAKPSPVLVRQAAAEREQRLAEQNKLYQEKYNTSDAQSALARYKSDYDKNTQVIDAMARKISPAKFVDNPPMSLDDSLDYAESKLPNGVPMVASKFESMTSSMTGLALKIDSVPQDRLVYLSQLPQLLTATGVIENGQAIPYETALDRQRNEILSLNAFYSNNPNTGRYELVLRPTGNRVDAFSLVSSQLAHGKYRSHSRLGRSGSRELAPHHARLGRELGPRSSYRLSMAVRSCISDQQFLLDESA